MPLVDDLENDYKRADLDKALERLQHCENLVATVRQAVQGLPRPRALRFLSICSDLYDYGGQYDNARAVLLKHYCESIEDRLRKFDKSADRPRVMEELNERKEEAWILFMLGMTTYRKRKYEDARRQFEICRKVFEVCGSSGGLSRAWQGLAIAYRQQHDYPSARAAFTRSIDFAVRAISKRIQDGKTFALLDAHLGRTMGLGAAWLSYDEALLTQASDAIYLAVRQLKQKNVKFMGSYVDVIRACVEISKFSDDIDVVRREMRNLKTAYDSLGGDACISDPSHAPGHGTYVLRAANELAGAAVCLARLVDEEEKQAVIRDGLSYVRRVTGSKLARSSDLRTYCTALVKRSRLHRENGEYDTARAVAEDALDFCVKNDGKFMTFNRIDCLIALGEAVVLGYPLELGFARKCFNEALKAGRNNRKVRAVCHLHLSSVHLAENRLYNADKELERGEMLASGLENAFILKLAAKIRQQSRDAHKGFYIQSDTSIMNPRYHEAMLHEWLVMEARRRTRNDNEASSMLRIGVTTLGDWLRDAAEMRQEMASDEAETGAN